MIEYYVEGIDLTGKSTVVRSISEKYSISSRHKFLSGESELMKEAKRVRAISGMGGVATSLAYIKAISDDIARHRDEPKNNKKVIQESTVIVKSYAIDKAMQADDYVLSEYDRLLKLHPNFTRSVFLTASTKQRLLRLDKRIAEEPETVTNNDLKLLRDPESVLRIEDVMKSIAVTAFNATVIDTSDMTPNEVSEEVSRSFGLVINEGGLI